MDSERVSSYTGNRSDILECIPLSSMTILDVGCSNGALGEELRKQVPDRRVLGIEFDSDFCAEASKRLNSVIQADMNHFEWIDHYEPELFDCMIFADVLEHLNDPWQVLRSSVNALAPDGLVVISLPNIRHISALYSIFVKGSFPRLNRGIFDSTHLRWFTLADSIDLCKQAELQVVKVVSRPRIVDTPGGRVNTFVDKHSLITSLPLIREFTAYQYILLAKRQ